MQRVPNVNFKKSLPRPKALFENTQQGMFYDVKTNIVMNRLDTGIPDLKKLESRKEKVIP